MTPCRAALVTSARPAAIATIELTGKTAQDILKQIFQPATPNKNPSPTNHPLLFGQIRDGSQIIDHVIIAADHERHTIAIHCHGGLRIVQRILMLLKKSGVQITPWQKLHPADSIIDEIAALLPLAKTSMTILAIAAQHPGGLTQWTQRNAQRLQAAAIPLQQIKADATTLLSSYPLAQKLLAPPTVALAGQPNVGKSSLANAITGHSQSVVADLPGTTRDWTVKLTDIEGIAISLIDTAGRRATGDLLERSAITRTDQQVQKADLVILLLEAGSNQAEHLQPPKDTLKNNPNVLIVCNKSDLLKSTDTHEKYLHIPARTGHNLDRLKKTIAARLGFESFDPQRPLIFTDRQYKLLTKLTTAQDVNSAIETLNTLIGQSPALTN